MSNIQDITSLSDILNTSPREPKDEINVPNRSTSPGAGPLESNRDAALNAHTQVEELIALQEEKSALTVNKDDLIKKRESIKDEIEQLRLKTKTLLDQRKHRQAQRKLDMLEEDKSTGKGNEKALPTPVVEVSSEDSDDKDIFRRLNVLPSDNWDDRLKFSKMFYEHISLTNATVQEGDEGTREISFTVRSENFSVFIRIIIQKLDNSLVSISLPNSNELTTISLLSLSFYSVLVKNYIPQRKINLLIYSLNSLAELVSKRLQTMTELVRLYPSIVDTPSPQRGTNSLTFKVNDVSSMVFVWNILLEDSITGEVETELKLLTIKHDPIQSTTSEVGSDVIVHLSNETDVLTAICVYLKNTYQIGMEEVSIGLAK
ncbi:hypothetical protein CLIB1423_02S02344 [[Candida] railenensis]|uniref:Uncharacterized protein n=1 Tax=[Candida] railenensis TaxID=45579 RepID=A0A9P0QLK2_9ASCO|nr:hypothetical protein CLIB1423_02S02344 [[Candida] railenensis]